MRQATLWGAGFVIAAGLGLAAGGAASATPLGVSGASGTYWTLAACELAGAATGQPYSCVARVGGGYELWIQQTG